MKPKKILLSSVRKLPYVDLSLLRHWQAALSQVRVGSVLPAEQSNSLSLQSMDDPSTPKLRKDVFGR